MSSEQDIVSELRNENGEFDARNLNRMRKDTHGEIDKQECYRIRLALLQGVTLRGYTAGKDNYATSAAHKHAQGECSHQDVGLPSLRHKREGEESGRGKWLIDGSERER